MGTAVYWHEGRTRLEMAPPSMMAALSALNIRMPVSPAHKTCPNVQTRVHTRQAAHAEAQRPVPDIRKKMGPKNGDKEAAQIRAAPRRTLHGPWVEFQHSWGINPLRQAKK